MGSPKKKASHPKKRGRGRPREHDERKVLSLRLPPDLHEVLGEVAWEEGVSLNTLLVEVLEDWWADHPGRRGLDRRLRRREE